MAVFSVPVTNDPDAIARFYAVLVVLFRAFYR